MPSTSRSRGSANGLQGSPRTPLVSPMSERQQLALVMQLTSQDQPPAAPTAGEERKRSRQQRNVRGETPLHVASIKGDHEQVKKLIGQGQDPNALDFAGWTPLHEACSYGWFEVVEVLVQGGADVNSKGLDDDTPLHDAVTSGNLALVKFLIDHGADPCVKNTKGKMPSDYAAPHICSYLVSLSENAKLHQHTGGARNEASWSKSNAIAGGGDCVVKGTMEGVAQELETQEMANAADKAAAENKEENQVSSSTVTPTQEESAPKRHHEEAEDTPEDDGTKRKKRKDEDKEPMAKPAPVARGSAGRALTGGKQPGPASRTGGTPAAKGGGQGSKGAAAAGKGGQAGQKGAGGKSGAQAAHQGKSAGSKAAGQGKAERKSPVASPKPSQAVAEDADDSKPQEPSAPKVPPLKIVLSGGAGNRNEQDGDGGSGQRQGKGRAAAPLQYVLYNADAGQHSDSSDGTDDKRTTDGKKQTDGHVDEKKKTGQRVLRSHRAADDKERSPQSVERAHAAAKTPPPATQGHEEHVTVSSSSTRESVDLHPRKRKIKASKESHREPSKHEAAHDAAHGPTHSNPYQMYIHIKKQIDHRQKGLFPVKPKPPKDFNKYLMNRCTYTLQSNVPPAPSTEPPPSLPPAMKDEFVEQERERHRLRMQHLVEKEKLVLAVEQEILRVHGRAERAAANQALPYSVCTILRDSEVYNALPSEQDEKRNAQRSRCNGRQIKSWLQEVDDKWEKIKEGMLRRQNTEAETLHGVQKMNWEWKLKELGLCDYKTTPKIDLAHVPTIHVANFDLPDLPA